MKKGTGLGRIMRRLPAVLATLGLVFSLSMCQSPQKTSDQAGNVKETPQETTTTVLPTSVGTTAATTAANTAATDTASTLTFAEAARQELRAQLDNINDTVEVDAADGNLSSISAAARLLNWGVGTCLTADEIAAQTADWVSLLDAAEKTAFEAKLTAVDTACRKLIGSEEKEVRVLLDAAGLEGAAYPWSDEPLETVEAMMTAAGLR